MAEGQTLKDFDGDYEYYLSQNQAEAVKMEVKEERSKEIEKDNIKAKSKVGGICSTVARSEQSTARYLAKH